MAGKKLNRHLSKYSSHKITKEELRELLVKGVIGRITGVVGPFVIRYKDDKFIISERPKLFRMSMTNAAISGRSKFSAGVRFAKFLAGIDIIKKLWYRGEAKKRNAWNKLVGINYSSGIPGITNTITPPGHHFNIEQICSLGNDFNIKINSQSELANKDTIFVVIVPFNSVLNSYEIFGLSSSAPQDEMKLNDQQIAICRKYKRYFLYTAVIRQCGDNLEWSNTIAVEGRFTERTETYSSVVVWNSLILLWLDYEHYKVNKFFIIRKRFIDKRRN